MSTTITVITVTRHRTHILPRAIASVQEQTYPASLLTHTILIDDCDETRTALGTTCLPTNVRVRFAARGIGDKSGPARLARLRNLAVRQANTRWIAFLDDDNVFLPEHIVSLVTCALETKCHAVHSYMQLFTAQGQPYLEQRWPWARDPGEAEQEYERLRRLGVYKPGSHISCDRIDPAGIAEAVRSVDTGEWLFARELLLAYPFPEQYSTEDIAHMTTEDDKLMQTLVTNHVPIGCTRQATLRYYLGGYSNTFRETERS